MSEPKKEKDTYRVRFEYDIIVRSGSEEAVATAAQFLQEAVVLNKNLVRTITKIDAAEAPETRMRIKASGIAGDGPPMFYRMPILVDSIETLAILEADAEENAKVKGAPGEGYLYRPDVKAGADGLDLRHTVTSKTAKGGVWIDVMYLRHMAQEAARQAQQHAQHGHGQQPPPPAVRGARR